MKRIIRIASFLLLVAAGARAQDSSMLSLLDEQFTLDRTTNAF